MDVEALREDLHALEARIMRSIEAHVAHDTAIENRLITELRECDVRIRQLEQHAARMGVYAGIVAALSSGLVSYIITLVGGGR